MQTEELAKKLYEAYCEGVGGVAYNGDKLPSADDFFTDKSKEKQVLAWTKAAEVAIGPLNETRELLLQATQNLGHPAYGHSSSTTIGIDNLREKCFDFLGVPKCPEDDEGYQTTAKSEGGAN